ncbi:MAG: transcription antitermination factor NusB [Cypionkella sp.]|uniref:RsmB/NOP family class I SAM-dependent RNA methyltransferase n=1 Tax=Cypionkella sp. TaxID=2811411 RepID=UPI002ABC03E5|nr:transcription antitermination factor NusB [Cypionkella sp.]MDZ4308974.1 transcription antitermination factor NusB [Cypionkella sp.]
MAEANAGLAARAATLAILSAIMEEGQTMAVVLANKAGALKGVGPQDRARAQRLALQVIRLLEPVDRLLEPHLRKAPPLAVMNILRLAVTELHEGTAAHGVVNTAVELARKGQKTTHMAGLINAVLRKIPEGAPLSGPAQMMPRWLRQPLVHAYGREVVSAIETVQAKAPPLDITSRGATLPEGTVLPTGSFRLTEPGQVSTLPGFATGDWWVQDAAAALAAPLVAAQPGEKMLDLCAAPGGKTLQLAATGAHVTALDISAPRMEKLRENLTRTKLQAKIVIADALHWQPDHLFDAVLLDAPCSATGTIRRHPELPFLKDGTELAELTSLQAALIDRALMFLKPGGRLVFCTCSLLPDEGEAQLTAALARHPGLRVERPDLAGIDPGWITPEGGLRLRPDYWADIGGMDGFFMARVSRG